MEKMFPWHISLWNKITSQNYLKRLPHSLLVLGIDGIGKFNLVQKLSNFLLCEKTEIENSIQNTNCGICNSCNLFNAGNHPDIIIINQEKKSHKQITVEQIRESILNLNKTSSYKRKIFIINNAELMNHHASNAILKTLEEPNPNIVIILISEYLQLLPITVVSRCQIIKIIHPTLQVTKEWITKEYKSINDLDMHIILNMFPSSPLRAIGLIKNEWLLKRNKFFDSFILLINNKINLIDFMLKCEEILISLDDFLLIFEFISSDLIKIKFGMIKNIINIDQKLILFHFNKISLKNLFLYRNFLIKIRQNVINGININKTLIIENLITLLL